MDALEALQTRTATPRLVEPAPGNHDLEQILKAGLRAPDHGMLRPWRFLVAAGAARDRLGRLFVEALQPEKPEEREKLLAAPLRAPLVIIGIAKVKADPKVPATEQVASMAAALQNMSVAAHALGFGSIWRTGPAAHDPRVKAALGLEASDEIVGYLYVGTPTFRDRPVPEHALADYVKHL